ncbi:MAG: hypothetical protein JW760_04890 [Spirochaetales bacterium]|nr:hypothetical protein [Spirochaetales bacterium]
MKKKLTVVVLIISLLALAFSSCELFAPIHTEEEVLLAWAITFSYGLTASIAYAFDPESAEALGITYNAETEVLTLSDFVIDDPDDDIDYASLSGTIASGTNDSSIFDFSLKGGTISEISYTMTEDQMNSILASESFDLDITADGRGYTIKVELGE